MIDPVTLFALANGAVSAVKAGCKLYKDIKGAAGDVRSVLKDLEDQFHKKHPPDKPASTEQRNQYIQEKTRVIELNKHDGNTTNVYQQIGEHLGTYYDNFYRCIAVLEEEERRSRTEVYVGDSSLGKRALQRVLMRKQLEQMGTELQELMIYQCPPELGALWTEVNEMMIKIGKEQKSLVAVQIQRLHVAEARRLARKRKLTQQAVIGASVLWVVILFMYLMMLVAYDRQERYPEFGQDIIPHREIKRNTNGHRILSE
jgi:hypothetical protein